MLFKEDLHLAEAPCEQPRLLALDIPGGIWYIRLSLVRTAQKVWARRGEDGIRARRAHMERDREIAGQNLSAPPFPVLVNPRIGRIFSSSHPQIYKAGIRNGAFSSF